MSWSIVILIAVAALQHEIGHRCGSNLIQTQGASATCSSCGSVLYGAR